MRCSEQPLWLNCCLYVAWYSVVCDPCAVYNVISCAGKRSVWIWHCMCGVPCGRDPIPRWGMCHVYSHWFKHWYVCTVHMLCVECLCGVCQACTWMLIWVNAHGVWDVAHSILGCMCSQKVLCTSGSLVSRLHVQGYCNDIHSIPCNVTVMQLSWQ